jgi:hypothetical protein
MWEAGRTVWGLVSPVPLSARHKRRSAQAGGPDQRVFFIDNLLVQIHVIIEMILVDWPCAMGI